MQIYYVNYCRSGDPTLGVFHDLFHFISFQLLFYKPLGVLGVILQLNYTKLKLIAMMGSGLLDTAYLGLNFASE